MARAKKKLGKDVRQATARVLAGLRAERRLHQRQMSLDLGKSHGWMGLLENEQYSVKLQDFIDLCAYFEVDPLETLARILRFTEENSHRHVTSLGDR
jgi:transcriptional regulator with XRE-family HTH domain